MVFIVVRRHFVDVFALYRRVGLAGTASEGMTGRTTNIGRIRGVSVISGNNAKHEKRKPGDESDFDPLFLSLLPLTPLPAFAQGAPELKLERVVIVSRHGVRAPTKSTQLMQEVTPDTWPGWPVKLGC